MNNPAPQPKPKPSPRPQSAMRRDFMQHSLQGLPTCKHCFWVFTSWPSFCMHFEKARCPVLHLGEMLAPTSRPATSLDSPQIPAIAPKSQPVHPEGPLVSTNFEDTPRETLNLTPDPISIPAAHASHMSNPTHTHNVANVIDITEDIPSTSMAPANPTNLLVDRIVNRYPCLPRDWCATALARAWKRLALNIKSTDFNHCLLCGQWLAHPGYLSRHVKSQHAEAYAFHAAVLKWLDDHKTAILSPCQFCGADFKARKCSRPRHAKECPILYRAGLLLRLCASYAQTATASASPTSGHGDPHEGCTSEGDGGSGNPGAHGGAGPSQPSLGHDASFSGGTGAICTERSRAGQHQGEHASGRGCSDGSSPGRAGSHGDAEGQTDGGERSPSRQGQRRPGEVAQALRQEKCQDIRRRDHSSQAPSRRRTTQSSRECRHDRSDRNWKSDTDRDKALLNLCLSMGRLLLRHEDQFGINRAQDTYVMFAQCQEVLSMVPELYVASEAKTMKKETPELLTLPLRAWLLKHWVDLMLKRMETIMMSEDTIKQAPRIC